MFIINKHIHEEDPSLWVSFLSGNDNAYSQIYKTYAKRLFIQGLQFTSDKELIKDCVQDVFVKIYKTRENLKPVQNIKVYLFIALRNTIITALSREKIQFDNLTKENGIDDVADENMIEDEFIEKETQTDNKQLIDKILSVLTSRQREVVHYRYFEDMNLNEIAILMDMNYQSTQNLLQRSIKKINEYLKKK